MKFLAWLPENTKKLSITGKKSWKKSTTFFSKKLTHIEKPLRQRPLISFFGFLIILLSIIAVSSFLRKPAEESTEIVAPTKTVQTVAIGQAPKIRVNGQVEKSGVLTLVAQAPGVVSSIQVEPGQNIRAGQTVVSMASNYSGGNIPALQAQIAQKQLENLENTYPQQKDLISKQRSVAEKQETNAEELRGISRDSISQSQDLLDLNEEILGSLDAILATATNSAQILQTKQLKAQVLSGVTQLRQQIAQTEYQSNNEKAPAQLAELQRDITLKQLELQEKSLELNREVTTLQAQVARVQVASMFPSSPFTARVERVHVKRGEFVQPGTPLVTIDCDFLTTQVIAKVPAGIAQQLNSLEPSIIQLGSETLELLPDYISQEATDGQLYSVQFTLPIEATEWLTDKSFVSVELPLGQADTTSSVPFVPLDAVHQNELRAILYVIIDGKAVAREVSLGSVQGRFVSIESGLEPGDQVIVDRNVVAGDQVTTSL